jgi:hypothetical protein
MQAIDSSQLPIKKNQRHLRGLSPFFRQQLAGFFLLKNI